MNKEFKEIIKKYLPSEILNFLIDSSYARKKNTNGLTIKKRESFFDIYDANKRCVRVSRMHNIYIQDIIDSFDYYFLAVKPIEINELHLVDYSTPRLHEVIGYELHPIMFSSFAEPLNTTKQYLEFAQLTNGSVALDLGAYSGLTSILFDRMVGNTGRVISVEADESNIKCVKTNFGLYNKLTGREIELMEGAIWKNDDGIKFSKEGNMGSSAVEYVGSFRGETIDVKTFTLDTIAVKHNLQRVDFIKCDIEGSESVIFNDRNFFQKFRPRIIVEPHPISTGNTITSCIDQLSQFGYTCKEVKQGGLLLPLLECYPS